MTFEEWKYDLETRAERCTAAEREKFEKRKALPPPRSLPEHAESLLKSPPPKIEHGDRIEIKESIACPGTWRVELNGELYRVFAGIDAHERALRFVNDSINQTDDGFQPA